MRKFILIILISQALWSQSLEQSEDIDGSKFEIYKTRITEDSVDLIVKRNSRVILEQRMNDSGVLGMQFTDFDNDKNQDLIISYIGNNPIYNLYIFNPHSHKLVFIEGFDRFCDVQRLNNRSSYFYSYQRVGCADENWESCLFKIEDFKTILIGHIYGIGCETADNKYIEIYLDKDNEIEKGMLIKRLPYKKFIKRFEDKWNFIKSYWEKNYTTFKV